MKQPYKLQVSLKYMVTGETVPVNSFEVTSAMEAAQLALASLTVHKSTHGAQLAGSHVMLMFSVGDDFGFGMTGPECMDVSLFAKGVNSQDNPWFVNAFRSLMGRDDNFLVIDPTQEALVGLDFIYKTIRDYRCPYEAYRIKNITTNTVTERVDPKSVNKLRKKLRNAYIMNWRGTFRSEVARAWLIHKNAGKVALILDVLRNNYPQVIVTHSF